MLLQSRPGCFMRAPPPRVKEGEMIPMKYNVKLGWTAVAASVKYKTSRRSLNSLLLDQLKG
mgnify:CR=1 FL=1